MIMEFSINNITKKYGSKQILKGVSFKPPLGACTGILGVNGSGKSTLLSILAGVQRADGGDFCCGSDSLFANSALRSSLVGYVPQGTPLIEELTAKDNLRLWYSRDKLRYELERGVLSMLGIDEFLNKTVSKLSGGMKKRLSIGCSMAGHPRILLLDEPSAAIDLVCKQNIADYISKFTKEGGTVIISTHDVSELSWCDKMYVLKGGILSDCKFDGDIKRLADNLK